MFCVLASSHNIRAQDCGVGRGASGAGFGDCPRLVAGVKNESGGTHRNRTRIDVTVELSMKPFLDEIHADFTLKAAA